MNNVRAILVSVVALLVTPAANARAAETTAICAQVESDPATRDLLETPPLKIEGADSFIYKTVNGVDLRMHVFSAGKGTRAKKSKKPAILFFFGGAWEYGTVKEFIAPAKHFSARGAVSILVDYRVFCRNGSSIVDEISDAKSAVRYIRAHAKPLGVDPNRIAVSGASAGGHLALSTATLDGFESPDEDLTVSSKPNFLALLYPCSDVTTEDEKKYGGDAIGSHGREASPLYHIKKNLPRMLIIQGTDDIVYESSKKFCSESRSLGNSCELAILPGASHGFFAPDVEKGKWYTQALDKMDGVLTKAGYLDRK